MIASATCSSGFFTAVLQELGDGKERVWVKRVLKVSVALLDSGNALVAVHRAEREFTHVGHHEMVLERLVLVADVTRLRGAYSGQAKEEALPYLPMPISEPGLAQAPKCKRPTPVSRIGSLPGRWQNVLPVALGVALSKLLAGYAHHGIPGTGWRSIEVKQTTPSIRSCPRPR